MKTLITALLFVTSTAFANDINRFGVVIPDDEGYSAPLPYWFIFYFFGGLWLGLNKNSPLYEWANEHPAISTILFLTALITLRVKLNHSGK